MRVRGDLNRNILIQTACEEDESTEPAIYEVIDFAKIIEASSATTA